MSLVLGIGARPGVSLAELEQLVTDTVTDLSQVSLVATLDAREADVRPLCAKHGWQLVTHPADVLAQAPVTGSARTAEAVGTPSVAEAAVLQHGSLLVPKTSSAAATLAVGALP